MSVRTSVSWSAHPGRLSGPAAFRGLTLRRVLRTSAWSRKTEYCIIWAGGRFHCCYVLFLKPAEVGVKCIEEVNVVITG